MSVVTDVRATQRTRKRTSGRTPHIRVDGRVRTSGRTCGRTYVRWHVHSSRTRFTYENKVDSSRPYFCTSRLFLSYLVLGRFRRTEIMSTRVHLIFVRAGACDEWTCQRTYVRSHVRPLVRHASVHSYAHTYAGSYARPSPRSSALVTRRTLSKITTFYETLKKANTCCNVLGCSKCGGLHSWLITLCSYK